MTEIKPVEGGPHDLVHTAVTALKRRRPYTAEVDALLLLLLRLCGQHQVPDYPMPDRRCSCGARIPWGDFAGVPCPEMVPVLDLAEAIVADDRRELVDLRAVYAANHSEQDGGTRG
ncbi:hypothetical protein [Actinomadura sp. CNU-125]|uniref:hypothetical protein n=1 Tax=Actinomadura sp. CNU-125 TaxID=1904961 RepID=UPI0011786DE0|nr:hypothetical protein [Actinomadura sp. CNU-125]